jgi:hypothetical protein
MLCKQHHWAFDNHVLLLLHHDGEYYVMLNSEYGDLLDTQSQAALLAVQGVISEERLPAPAFRPHPEFIQRLYADVDNDETIA